MPAGTSFKQRLEAHASLIETRLGEWLTPKPAGGAPERLLSAMRHAALGGGKRLRPHLLIESAGLFGLPPDDALDAAAALECVHCYSLIHDDLPAMDDDDLRRGRPTVHKAFDEATAILAGDALLTLAFEILCAPSPFPSPAVRAELALELARAAGMSGMAGGQMSDLQAPGQNLGEGDIWRLQSMKTGALIAFACEAGAILAQAKPGERKALKAYGVILGRAFQLADDLIDVEGDRRTAGKATGKDQAAGKATIVALMGTDAARALLLDFEHEAAAALSLLGGRAAPLIDTAHFVVHRNR